MRDVFTVEELKELLRPHEFLVKNKFSSGAITIESLAHICTIYLHESKLSWGDIQKAISEKRINPFTVTKPLDILEQVLLSEIRRRKIKSALGK